MKITLEKATVNDIETLVQLRLEYLTEDYGVLTDEQVTKISSSLPDYYGKHINQDLLVYVARAQEKGLDYIELKSTDAGYLLYQSLGFRDDKPKYHIMKRVL